MKTLYSRTNADNQLEELFVYFSPNELKEALQRSGLVPEGLQPRYAATIKGGELYVEMDRLPTPDSADGDPK